MTPLIVNALPRTGYQGEHGAFSEMAAHQFFPGGVSLVPCATFDELFAAFKDGRIEFMVAPVENSIAGKVERVISLLRTTPHIVVNEIELPIIQSLIGIPGAQLVDVRIAESHPVAIAQCREFFVKNPGISPIESNDTAASVRCIMDALKPSRAAIASAWAAEIYGANILIAGIQDHADNFTRFQLLKNKSGERQ